MKLSLLLASFCYLAPTTPISASSLPTLSEVLTQGFEIISNSNVGTGEVFRIDLSNDETAEFYSCYLRHDVRKVVERRRETADDLQASHAHSFDDAEERGDGLMFDQNGMLVVPGSTLSQKKRAASLNSAQSVTSLEISNSCIKAS